MHNPKIFPALELVLKEYEQAKQKGTLVLRDLQDIMDDSQIDEKDLESEGV